MSTPINLANAVRPKVTSFRNFISSVPNARFPPEANRYHLYVSLACPWAHRALLTREIKGLNSLIGLSIVHWYLDDKGWRFINADELAKVKGPSDVSLGTVDHVNGAARIRELYDKSDPEYTGRYTVPVLWDKKTNVIVNNESADIVQMLNSEFNSLLPEKYAQVDLYPSQLDSKIKEMDEWVHQNINTGGYRAGMASSQEAYTREVTNLFENLDRMEKHLATIQAAGNEFVLGEKLTVADIRLYVTIVRFDPVYVQALRCNIGTIRHDYPHIHRWLRYLYWKVPGFQETTDFHHIKFNTASHKNLNPSGIVAVGPLPHILPL